MRYCQHCQSVGLKPCRSLCIDVMNTCLLNFISLQREWDRLIGSFERLAIRLESPFNIGEVIGPLHIKISEAIMNFQENSSAVNENVSKHFTLLHKQA